jgi:hypothetical protein
MDLKNLGAPRPKALAECPRCSIRLGLEEPAGSPMLWKRDAPILGRLEIHAL